MRFSIVIPTLNEEKYLPKLLNSIKKQTLKDYEIIVSDAGSNDKTKIIAKKQGCKTVNGGMPSIGRNSGAKKAKGEILIFFDSDVEIVSKNFLREVDTMMKKVEVAAPNYVPDTKNIFFRLSYYVANKYILLTRNISGCAIGHCIICKKDLFNLVGGFDETIVFSEDYEFSARASKKGKFMVLKNLDILVSMRRFDKDGWTMIFKALYATAYRIFIGEIRKPLFKYEFGKY